MRNAKHGYNQVAQCRDLMGGLSTRQLAERNISIILIPMKRSGKYQRNGIWMPMNRQDMGKGGWVDMGVLLVVARRSVHSS